MELEPSSFKVDMNVSLLYQECIRNVSCMSLVNKRTVKTKTETKGNITGDIELSRSLSSLYHESIMIVSSPSMYHVARAG